MKRSNKISVGLGIILVMLTGCWSEQKNQEIESEDWFGGLDKMLGVNEKN